MGLRERRRELVRREIADGALRLFAERGFDAVTVSQIASSVDVSARTIFRYFPSKQDILFARHDEQVIRFRETLAGRPPEEPVVDVLRAGLVSMTDIYDLAEGEALALKARVITESPILLARSLEADRELRAAVIEEVSRRLDVDPASDALPPLVAAMWTTALRLAVSLWLDGGRARPLSAVMAELLDLLEPDFRTTLTRRPPGRRRARRPPATPGPSGPR